MSDNAIRDEIIDPMLRLFSPPKAMDEAQQIAAMRDYMDAMRGFSRNELQAAWREVRDTTQTRTWPPIAVFVKAAAGARKHQKTVAGTETVTGPRHKFDDDGWKAYFWANWRHIKYTMLAKEAARDGWALMLKSAILDGIPLSSIEPHAMTRKVERAVKLATIIEENQNFPNRETALKMYHNLLISRQAVDDEIAAARGAPPAAPFTPAFDYPFPSKILKNPPDNQMRIYDLQGL